MMMIAIFFCEGNLTRRRIEEKKENLVLSKRKRSKIQQLPPEDERDDDDDDEREEKRVAHIHTNNASFYTEPPNGRRGALKVCSIIKTRDASRPFARARVTSAFRRTSCLGCESEGIFSREAEVAAVLSFLFYRSLLLLFFPRVLLSSSSSSSSSFLCPLSHPP